MKILFEALLLFVLIVIFIQDLKYRAIHFLLPIAILLLGVYDLYIKNIDIGLIGYNGLFLLVTFLGLYMYLSFKNKSSVNLLKSVGLGDFLFFAALTPFFITTNFILFFITAMLFSLMAHMIILKLQSDTNLVPLAGLVALFLLLLKVVRYITGFDFFYGTGLVF